MILLEQSPSRERKKESGLDWISTFVIKLAVGK
jgi:hypothetical protein